MNSFQNTNTDALMATRPPIGRQSNGGLGRRLVVHILTLNLLLSAVASSIQLYAGYHRDRTQILGAIDTIDLSLRSGFEGALWEYNFQLVEALLDGIHNKADVQNVVLSTPQGRLWERGVVMPGLKTQEIEFTHTKPNGTNVVVGTLQVGLSTERAAARVRSQFWTLLLSNFAKTICASIVMLALFNRDVGRHLKRIASTVSQTSWQQTDNVITLDRAQNEEPDDIDLIINAIHTARWNSKRDFEKLTREVAQRREAEALLRNRTDALENANKEQAQFTYAISHDLKSPANTVQMLIDELKLSEEQHLSEDGWEILGDADRTIKRMMDLVEDVLGYARTVEDDMKVEPVDLNFLIEAITEDLRADISAAGAQIDARNLPVVFGNAVQLRMLFQNLIANAVKFRVPEKPPLITIRASSNSGGETIVSVQDNGIGIARKFHKRVFGLFQRLHSHGAYSGSGLGLTLCKRIVLNHKGEIALTSAPNEGCCFRITLPGRIHDTCD